jgi:hypothetical protein
MINRQGSNQKQEWTGLTRLDRNKVKSKNEQDQQEWIEIKSKSRSFMFWIVAILSLRVLMLI